MPLLLSPRAAPFPNPPPALPHVGHSQCIACAVWMDWYVHTQICTEHDKVVHASMPDARLSHLSSDALSTIEKTATRNGTNRQECRPLAPSRPMISTVGVAWCWGAPRARFLVLLRRPGDGGKRPRQRRWPLWGPSAGDTLGYGHPAGARVATAARARATLVSPPTSP